MEKKVVNFTESKKEIDERKRNEEIKYFLNRIRYGKFVEINRTKKYNLFKVTEYEPYALGFLYYNCFFYLDETNNRYRVYHTCLNIKDYISGNTEPGLYVNELQGISFNTLDDFDFHAQFVEDNLPLLREVDKMYNKMKEENDFKFSNDPTFLEELENHFYNNYVKPINFKKEKKKLKLYRFIESIKNKIKIK